jgi:hypothetical protein
MNYSGNQLSQYVRQVTAVQSARRVNLGLSLRF